MNRTVTAPQPRNPAVATLYRRLIKMYIKKFDTNHEVIVRAWKQTKFEFYHYRQAPADDVPFLIARGNDIYANIAKGIIPIKEDPTTKKIFVAYDDETLRLNNNSAEPLSGEEFLRRSVRKYSSEELKDMQQMLVQAGRWQGKLEFDRVPNMKKRKLRCTDPDPPATPAAEDTPKKDSV
jgi:maltooligosyltrehalose synthase